MYIIIRDAKGALREAVLLSAGRRVIRLVQRGRNDAAEYRLSYGQWLSENGEPVELESMVSDGGTDLDAILSVLCEKTLAAGAELLV